MCPGGRHSHHYDPSQVIHQDTEADIEVGCDVDLDDDFHHDVSAAPASCSLLSFFSLFLPLFSS